MKLGSHADSMWAELAGIVPEPRRVSAITEAPARAKQNAPPSIGAQVCRPMHALEINQGVMRRRGGEKMKKEKAARLRACKDKDGKDRDRETRQAGCMLKYPSAPWWSPQGPVRAGGARTCALGAERREETSPRGRHQVGRYYTGSRVQTRRTQYGGCCHTHGRAAQQRKLESPNVPAMCN